MTVLIRELLDRWRAAWPEALKAWSAYTLLRDPKFLLTEKEAGHDGMAGEIAAIRLQDHAIMVNVNQIREKGLEDLALPILAHEVGHHVYVPGSLTDNGRLTAVISRMLQGLSVSDTHLTANLYADLLINDRLHRRANVDMASVYRKLNENLHDGEMPSQVWKIYTRTYEFLWRLPQGTLSPKGIAREMESDALLLSRIIRHFAGDWLLGARRFAVVLYHYLAMDSEKGSGQTFVEVGLHDTKNAGAGEIPDGLTSIDPSEVEEDDGFDEELGFSESNQDVKPGGKGHPGSQARQPFEYQQLLESLGLNLSKHEMTTRYYRERALPHLIPFPTARTPRAKEPLREGLAIWEPGDPMENLDVVSSVIQSPYFIPGVTALQPVYGWMPGSDPEKKPMDLDIYVDCSASMPDPSLEISYLALAGTILALSALRAGARVQATLWSSAGIFDTTGGFIRDEKRILGIITGYISGGTAFPLHILRDTYENRKTTEPPSHIVVISDDGADTMLNHDEKRTPGEKVCIEALENARGGGTLVLNLPNLGWSASYKMKKIGFHIHAVREWEDLVKFARDFVKENYEDSPSR